MQQGINRVAANVSKVRSFSWESEITAADDEWVKGSELGVYDADSDIVELVFSGVQPVGRVIVVSDELDKPAELSFESLAEDVDKLSASLIPVLV